MKNLRKAAMSLGAMLALESHIFAQSAAPIVGVTIPATFSMVSNIRFGNLPQENDSVVVKTADNTGNKTTTSRAPAYFSISGIAGYTFGITLPDIATIADKNRTIVISGFTSSPAGTGILSAKGTRMIKVGATLFIHAAKKPDNYTTETDMPVTVNYN